MLARLLAARSTAVAGMAEVVIAGAAVCVQSGRVRGKVSMNMAFSRLPIVGRREPINASESLIPTRKGGNNVRYRLP